MQYLILCFHTHSIPVDVYFEQFRSKGMNPDEIRKIGPRGIQKTWPKMGQVITTPCTYRQDMKRLHCYLSKSLDHHK